MNNFEFEDTPKHKKKKDQSSKSNRRSDHKHNYVKVITSGWLMGFTWAYRCSVCGRIKSVPFSENSTGLTREEKPRVYGKNTYLSIEEIHEKFPDIDIYVAKEDPNNKYWFCDDNCLEKIIFD